MEPQIIRGIWDDVAQRHAAILKGHRVEIHVLDASRRDMVTDKESFESSMLRLAELTRDAAPISPEPLRGVDFYESPE